MRGTPRSVEVAARCTRQRRGQRPHRGAGVAEEEVGLLRRRARRRAPVTRSVRSPSLSMPQPSARSASSITRGVVGVEQVVHVGRARAPARPAAARGWRCSSSPAARTRAAGRGAAAGCRGSGSCTCGDARRRATRLSGACAASTRSSASRRARRLALRISAFERLGVAGLDDVLHRVERVRGSAATASASLRGWPCRMSRHTAGSLAAMRVKSRKPGPAERQEVVALPAGAATALK